MKMALGIQGIIFGARNGNLPELLPDVKAIGYDGLEIGVPDTEAPVEGLKQLFDTNGLRCCGFHTGFDTFRETAKLEKIAEHLTGMDAHHIMCSGTAGRDRDGYLRSAEIFNQAGSILREHGATLCYHNHNWEFFPIAGAEGSHSETGMDILLANTDPQAVKLCIDVYWVACGGLDPVAFIQKNAERAVYFHFKDGTFDAAAQKPLTFTELGHGQVNLKAITPVVQALHPTWIVTEQDHTDGDPVESARISLEYARHELHIA